jgi:hypothetical protein
VHGISKQHRLDNGSGPRRVEQKVMIFLVAIRDITDTTL